VKLRVARDKSKNEKISVLKGRQAKLNYAIFHILALKGPLTIYDIHKEVKIRRRLKHLRYATVNKRVRALEESGYIKKIGVKKTKAGFEAAIYELTARAYLAVLLSQINMDRFLEEAEDDAVLSALAALSSGAQPLSMDRKSQSEEHGQHPILVNHHSTALYHHRHTKHKRNAKRTEKLYSPKKT